MQHQLFSDIIQRHIYSKDSVSQLIQKLSWKYRLVIKQFTRS